MNSKSVIIALFAAIFGATAGLAAFNFLADEAPINEVASYYRYMAEWAKSDEQLWTYGLAAREDNFQPPQPEVYPQSCYYKIVTANDADSNKISELMLELYETIGYSYTYFLQGTNSKIQLCIKHPDFNPEIVSKYGKEFKVEKLDQVSDPRRELINNVYLALPSNQGQRDSIVGIIYKSHPDKLEVLVSRFELDYFVDQFSRKDWVITGVTSYTFEPKRGKGVTDVELVRQLQNSFNIDTTPTTEVAPYRIQVSSAVGLLAAALTYLVISALLRLRTSSRSLSEFSVAKNLLRSS